MDAERRFGAVSQYTTGELAKLCGITVRTVIVFYGVINAKKGYLPLAILLHMLMDTFPALYQKSAVPLWSVEAWAALCTAVVVFIAVRLYRKLV